jgi:hypothetical protein
LTTDDLFRRIVTALDKAQVPYMITGSYASAYYGTPRASQDIDVVIAPNPDQLRVFLELLPSSEYYVDAETARAALARSSQFNVIDLASGWKIDFIARKARPFSREEFARRVPVELHGIRVFMTTAEDVIIAKLEWAKLGSSQRQLEDVAGVLRVRPDLNRDYISRWVTNLELETEWQSARTMAGEHV